MEDMIGRFSIIEIVIATNYIYIIIIIIIIK